MKILHLTPKKKHFDMIDAGIKLEEYRELSHHWFTRLSEGSGNTYDAIRFYNGWIHSPKLPNITVKCRGIQIGKDKKEWGAVPGKEYFVISLGEKILDI